MNHIKLETNYEIAVDILKHRGVCKKVQGLTVRSCANCPIQDDNCGIGTKKERIKDCYTFLVGFLGEHKAKEMVVEALI